MKGRACEQAQGTGEPMSSKGFRNIGVQRVNESGIGTVFLENLRFFRADPCNRSEKTELSLISTKPKAGYRRPPKQRPEFHCIIERVENRAPKLEPSPGLP